MAEKDLNKHLDELFADLEEALQSSNSSESASAKNQPSRQLAGLFSDPADSTKAIAPPAPASEPEEPEDSAPTEADVEEVKEKEETSAPAMMAYVEEQWGEQIAQLLKDNQTGPLPSPEQLSDPREAAQKLPPKQSQWAIDPMLEAAGDSDPGVARLVIETLREMDAAVKSHILSLALRPKAAQHQGAEAYLSYLLGQPVVHVPLGSFMMGSDPATDPMSDSCEQPQHETALIGFWIGRYPVTVAQFRTFLADSGYNFASNKIWQERDNMPMVDVSWYDALAYCRWLSERHNLPITLPSEAEWEKTARGTDGRRYPWGNQDPTPELCSFEQATPVGQYSPQADSPYGCADMAGNVWEWTRSTFKPYPYDPRDRREDTDENAPRVIRGLTFNNPAPLTRAAYRYRLKPHHRLPMLGFRIVISPL